jgi:acylphosphatase
VTCRFIVGGVVQGVGFRWFVARHARGFGLTGFASNLPDGRVEVVVAGDEQAIASLEERLRTGPAHARVEQVSRENDVTAVLPPGSFDIQ